MNYFSDSEEWKYLFRNAIDWDKILPLYYPTYPTPEGFNNKEDVLNFFEELLTTTGDWAANSIAPRARRLDEEGSGNIINQSAVPSAPLKELYEEAKSLAVFGLSVDPKYGGLGVPSLVSLLALTQISRACLSSSTQIGFFTSIADMIERFGSEEDRENLIPKILAGELSGSMCLTEPGAGSDVGSIRTTATKQEDGTYLLNGQKCFITNGGGGIGLVLARIKGAPEGLTGISLFLAEEWIEGEKGEKKHNYLITKNEKKLGLSGSFTCEVVYENTKAKLVGKENEGFQIMLHLMNEARIAVGLQGLGGLEACIGHAREYAETRSQFGKNLLDLPLYRRNLQDWETERDAFRALMVDTIVSFDIYQRLHHKQEHGESLTTHEKELFKDAKKWVRRRTPLVKYYGAEAFTGLSTRTIQALGGYGFMKEYDMERFHRDSFGPLLYEGTSQIQALMALKDLIKFILKDPSKYILSTFSLHPILGLKEKNSVKKEFSKVSYEFKKALLKLLFQCLRPEQIADLLKPKSWQNEKNIEKLMSHAETICQGLSYIETLRVLCLQADKDSSRADLFFRYKNLVWPRLVGIFSDWNHVNKAAASAN